MNPGNRERIEKFLDTLESGQVFYMRDIISTPLGMQIKNIHSSFNVLVQRGELIRKVENGWAKL